MEARQINRQFKILRASAGLTQKQIERLTGIYTSKISYFEQGFANPTSEEIKKLASCLGVQQKEIEKCFENPVEATYGKKTKSP